MEWVLGVCTILGGAAALWFFWDRITGKTERKHGATVEDALSRSGSITADDQTGQGASVKRADAKKDITASSRTAEGPSSPKESPPRP
jgi:hypothetical protein